MVKRGYRQGEIGIFELKRSDTKTGNMLVRLKPKSNLIIREGEATGHMHKLAGDVELLEDEFNNMFINVKEGGATLDHPEHKTIHLPEGFFEVVIQREYDEERDRRVAD